MNGVLGLTALVAVVSGIIITSRIAAASGVYDADHLFSDVADVIIGGTALNWGVGSLIGTFAGIMIIVTINDGLVLLNVSQFWQQLVVGLIFMDVVLIDQATRGYLNTSWLTGLFRRQAPNA